MKIALNMFYDNFKQFFNKNKFLVAVFMLVMVIGIVAVPRIFAVLQPVKSVEIFSEKLDYNSKEPGAWKVTKSAKWTSKSEAEITFDVDSIMKTNNKDTDVLLVLDISGSMNGDKLNRVKTDSIELIESLLSNNKNKVGLIAFDSTSEIISDFTTDKETLINNINNLGTKGCTNYYQALVNVDSVLKNYVKETDKDCVVLFLTDGYPNEETPNEEAEYDYLKKQYTFVTINGIQYEMGESILEPIKKVSDNQFIANMDTLNNVLFDASIIPVLYENFEITDYIDTDYFYVEDSKDIKVNQGKVSFDKENQKITWTMNGYRSGSKAKMIIKAKLKEENISQDSNFPTNKREEIKSKLEDTVEDVVSTKTPVLASKYKVTYDANVPSGCEVSGGIPNENSYSVFDTVELSNSTLNCEGYQFRGWEISTRGVVSINDDYFTMPEEDVVIRGVWTKLSLNKSMDGEVKEYIPATLETYGLNSTKGLHKYNTSLTDIIFQDSMSNIGGAKEVIDISAEKNNGILAYIVPNADNSTRYTAYIQGDGGVVANSDSSHLFANFYSLKSIQNLKYLDTSNVTNMSAMFNGSRSLTSLDLSSFDMTSVMDMSFMFWGCSNLSSLNLGSLDTSSVKDMECLFYDCSSLTNLDLSSLDTLNVTNMSSMFRNCCSLESLDLSSFDTSNVTDMSVMFYTCRRLRNLDLSSFDTSNVVDMGFMFYGCSGLTNLNLNNFDTSNATDMSTMFYECKSLTSLNVSNFNTSKVTSMSFMFYGCSGLTNLNLNNFDISNVTDMSTMFYGCSSLSSLNLSNFDTSNVVDMSSMFYGCSGLTSLDLSNFSTSKVTDISSMFGSCSNLTSLDLTSFNTSNVVDMGYMFRSCKSLTSLNLSSFDTSDVADMGYMFDRCSGLISLDLNSFSTSNVTVMQSMFNGCNSLVSLDLSKFDTSSVIDMQSMFSGCSSLLNLSLNNFTTSNVTNMYEMFYNCSCLTTTISITNILTSYSNMFRSAATAEGAKITVNYTENVVDAIDTYIETKSLKSNVVKGEKFSQYMITVVGNDDIEPDSIAVPFGKIIKLNSKSGESIVTSFKMNGTLVKGNKFKMPAENVSITDIVVLDAYIIESEHNPYLNSLNNKIYGEKTFDEATSLTVDLDCQTENTSFDWIYLYDSTGKSYGRYGGDTRKTETIIIPGNYIKIVFRTDSSGNNYYGFRAKIFPNYD